MHHWCNINKRKTKQLFPRHSPHFNWVSTIHTRANEPENIELHYIRKVSTDTCEMMTRCKGVLRYALYTGGRFNIKISHQYGNFHGGGKTWHPWIKRCNILFWHKCWLISQNLFVNVNNQANYKKKQVISTVAADKLASSDTVGTKSGAHIIYIYIWTFKWYIYYIYILKVQIVFSSLWKFPCRYN